VPDRSLPAQEAVIAKPLAPTPEKAPESLFERLVPAQTGIDFVNPIENSNPLNRLYASSMCAGGVAVGDADNDGKPDLFFTGGPGKNRLFRQTDSFKFVDITAESGPVDGGDAWGTGCAWADVDGDGDLDLYVCNYQSPNQLFLNQFVPTGKLTFSTAADAWGAANSDAGHTPAFCDYDRDGDLDLYLMTNLLYHPKGRPDSAAVVKMVNGFPQIADDYKDYLKVTKIRRGKTPADVSVEWDKKGRPHKLLRNIGGKFEDVTVAAGLHPEGAMGLSAIWWDFDQDGWMDLYVGSDFDDADRFYHNQRDGTFKDIVEAAVPNTTWFSMGADFGDLDGDGRPDFLTADMMGSTHYKQKTAMGNMSGKNEFLVSAFPRQYMRNALYLNTGTSRFLEAAQQAGLDRTDWTWAVMLADFDADGRTDAFFTNGMSRNYNDSDNPAALESRIGETEWDRHRRGGTAALKEQNLAYRNLGELKFQDVSKTWGLDHVGMSFAAARADFDRDGWLDLVVVNLDEPVYLYRNRGVPGNHRLLVELVARAGDRRGVGAEIRLQSASGPQVAQIVLNRGYMAGQDTAATFGLGRDDTISRMEIRWPSGQRQVFKNVPSDQHLKVFEPKSDAKPTPDNASKPTALFTQAALGVEIMHSERPYDDFAREPLLPNKLSQLGPGLAVADIDGDGDEDFFLGDGAGSAGKLFRNDGSGTFRIVDAPVLEADAASEDMGCLFFDADADGDADLYVVSGGVECEPGDPILTDRLYVNDGAGKFTKSPAALPNEKDSGSCVCAADFDRDGDLDLFVGGRIVPGAYPTAPPSRLLRNEKGKFSDVASELAPALTKAGMVTGAVWTDLNDDGFIDLVLVREWGGVLWLENRAGKSLEENAAARDLAERSGWWNGIVARDCDGDGDIDLLATNFGLNTKYRPTWEKPALLYYGAFDEQGKRHLVEAEFEHDTVFPVRGRSCSSQAMPFIREKFKTFKDFAGASLKEIYDLKLEEAERFSARELRSGIFRNDGQGKFAFEPLPWKAQVAPGFGALFGPLTGAPGQEIVLAQNFYNPQPETGHFGGGIGLLLQCQTKEGGWSHLDATTSGILVPGDAKSLVRINLDADGLPDLIFGVNQGAGKAWRNSSTLGKNLTQVRLKGKKGNPTAIGAKITAHFADGSSQVAEIFGGDGYLSQSSATQTFSNVSALEKLHVRWPDGTTTSAAAPKKNSRGVVEIGN
jgi:hypothetical protein